MGEFVKHIPCPKCGSSDANSEYDDGSTYCFSCKHYYNPNAKAKKSRCGTYLGANDQTMELTVIDDGLIAGEYLDINARNIDITTCSKYSYQLGLFNGRPCHIANYYKDRKIIAQHLRFQDKSFSWLGNAKGSLELFGQHLWPDGGKVLVITEGEIDCLTISKCNGNKWPVVSLPSGAQSAAKYIKMNLEFVESFQEIVLAFDDDEPGIDAVDSVINVITPGKIKVMKYDGFKDANELFLAKGSQAVVSCFWQAKQYRPGGILSGQDIWNEVIKPIEKGFEIPYPKLNEMIAGARRGELCVITAGSGIGKSTIAKEIVYHLLMKHGCSIGIMSLEESVSKTSRALLGIHINSPLAQPGVDLKEDELRKAYDEVLNNERVWFYQHWGSNEIDVLLNKIKYMRVANGCDFIMLDHISIVVSGLSGNELEESERKTIDLLMTKLRKLVEETGVGIIAVSHVKRKNEGKGFNEGKQISLTDLRGSASIEQLSDIVIGVERNQQGKEPNKAIMRVLKNRPLGVTGEADTLYWNPITGRLMPLAPPNIQQSENSNGIPEFHSPLHAPQNFPDVPSFD